MTHTSSVMVSSEEATRDRAGLQAWRQWIVRQERHGERPPALPLQRLPPQLHGDAAPRQAAGDEGAGGAALRPGQRQPGHDRQAARGEPRRGLQVGPGCRRGGARAFDHTGRQHRPDRRDVALRGREKKQGWLWRAYDPVARRTLAWELGGRDDATCRRLLDKVGVEGHVFLTDDWEGFHRLIPEGQLFTGKDLTFPIEQDNSDVRHHLAPFRRRSKVTSRARHMVDGALKLLCHLRRPENFLPMRDSFLSIFG